jgi:hypothetical protein
MEVMIKEVSVAFRALKNNRAPGRAELLKFSPQEVLEQLTVYLISV